MAHGYARDRAVRASATVALDRYAASHGDFVSFAREPHGGPRRAKRAEKIVSNQSRALTGYQGQSPWLVLALAMTLACTSYDRPDRPGLRPVPQPDSSHMSEAVREQVRQRYTNLSTKLGTSSTPSPELATAFGEVGELLLAARYLETAEPALLNARTLAPKDPRWPYYLAHLYRIRGALDEGAVFFQEALERGADNLATLTWLASVYIDLGRYDAAEPLLESALRRDPMSAATHYHAGRLRLARRDFAGAVQHLETALKQDPRGAAIRYPLALAYRGLGRQADADAQLRGRDQSNSEIVPPDPLMDRLAELLEGPQAHTVRGTEALNRGEWARAADEFRKGLTLVPRNPLLRHRFATALFMMGNVDEAQRGFEEVIRLSPDYSAAHYSLGLLFEGRGR